MGVDCCGFVCQNLFKLVLYLLNLICGYFFLLDVVVVFLRYPFSADQDVSEPDWEVFLRDTASMIVQEQSPRR
jgi:hypothetical protein